MLAALMVTRTSATVTMNDLKTFFKGEGWSLSGLTDNAIEAKSKFYDISVTSKSFKYNVSIEATDDPSDSEKTVTNDPLKFLVKFLGTGTSADEAFSKRASPNAMVGYLRLLALQVEKQEIGPHEVARSVRRMMAVTDTRYASGNDIEKADLDDLKEGMQKKGWKVSESQTKNGKPELSVDISGIYSATISVEGIEWEYSFEVRNVPESKQHGTTDDPIGKFRNYTRDETVHDYKRKSKEQSADTIPASGTEPTVRPDGSSRDFEQTNKSGVKPSQEEKTVRPSREEKTVRPGA